MDHVLFVFLSLSFYSFLHWLSRKFFIPILPQKKLADLTKGDLVELAEKIPSMVNGVIVPFLSFHLIFIKRAFQNDIFTDYPEELTLLFCNLVGYTLYDLITAAYQPKTTFDIWLHHILGLFGCVGILYFKQAAFIPAAFGITELTVVPHHIIWIIRRVGDANSRLYRGALLSRAFLFLVLRLPMAPFTIWYALQHQGSVSGTTTDCTILWYSFLDRWNAFHPILTYGTAFNFLVFALLNTVWSFAVVYLCWRHFFGKEKKGSKSFEDRE